MVNEEPIISDVTGCWAMLEIYCMNVIFCFKSNNCTLPRGCVVPTMTLVIEYLQCSHCPGFPEIVLKLGYLSLNICDLSWNLKMFLIFDLPFMLYNVYKHHTYRVLFCCFSSLIQLPAFISHLILFIDPTPHFHCEILRNQECINHSSTIAMSRAIYQCVNGSILKEMVTMVFDEICDFLNTR